MQSQPDNVQCVYPIKVRRNPLIRCRAVHSPSHFEMADCDSRSGGYRLVSKRFNSLMNWIWTERMIHRKSEVFQFSLLVYRTRDSPQSSCYPSGESKLCGGLVSCAAEPPRVKEGSSLGPTCGRRRLATLTKVVGGARTLFQRSFRLMTLIVVISAKPGTTIKRKVSS